jgi:hypothetical protein
MVNVLSTNTANTAVLGQITTGVTNVTSQTPTVGYTITMPTDLPTEITWTDITNANLPMDITFFDREAAYREIREQVLRDLERQMMLEEDAAGRAIRLRD